MKPKNFSCPKCGTGIPKRTTLFLTKFTRIQCKQCGIVIRPKKRTISIVNYINAGLVGGIFFPVGMYLINRGNWVVTGLLFFALLVFVILVSSYLTIKFTKFIEN